MIWFDFVHHLSMASDIFPDNTGQVMGYSSFRHFLKDQFPNLRFHKDDIKSNPASNTAAPGGGESRTSNSYSVNSAVIIGGHNR